MAMFLVLYLLPGSSLSPLSVPSGMWHVFSAALVGAAFATVAEAISPHGTDNLSVPLVATAVVGVMVW